MFRNLFRLALAFARRLSERYEKQDSKNGSGGDTKPKKRLRKRWFPHREPQRPNDSDQFHAGISMTTTLSPAPKLSFLDNNGKPAVGGKLSVLVDFTNWAKNFGRRPSHAAAFGDQSLREASLPGPLGHGHRDPVERDMCATAPIIGLRCSRIPRAIPRFIVAIVVKALYGVPCWHRPHVGKKVLEFVPSAAYLDSPASIIMEGAISGVCTSTPEVRPGSVGRGFRHSVGSVFGSGNFPAKTSTGFSRTLTKGASRCLDFSAAVTQAFPTRSPTFGVPWSLFFGHKPTESVSYSYAPHTAVV